LLLFAAAGWYDRSVILRGAHLRLLSTADALARTPKAVLQTAELALSLQLDAVKGMDWQTISSSGRCTNPGQTGCPTAADRVSVFVNPAGHDSSSSRVFPMPHYDVRDREYYVAASNGETGTVISAPFHGSSQGKFGFTVSRARITDANSMAWRRSPCLRSYFGDLYRMCCNRRTVRPHC
jgi:hypothetical protein